MRRGWLLLFSLLAVSSTLACGYALVGRASNVPEDVKRVYLKPFENRTPRPQVEQILTRAIADELVTRQRFAVASDPAAADAEISGAVLGFGVTPVTFDTNGRAIEYEISITSQVRFRRLSDDQTLWSNDRYLFRQSYPLEISDTGYFDRENLAIEDVAGRFAETMVSDLLEGF